MKNKKKLNFLDKEKKLTKKLKDQKEISTSAKNNSKLCPKGVNTFVRGPKPRL